MSESDSRGAFFAGLFLGGLVGAAAALLMAPQPGYQTRIQIKAKGGDFQSQLGDVTSRVQDRGRAIVHPTPIEESDEGNAGPAQVPSTEDDTSPDRETTS